MVGWLCVCVFVCVCVGAGTMWEISVSFVQFCCEPKTALGFPCSSAGKESGCNAGDLGWEDCLEKGKATHSCILAWRILWTVQSMMSQKVGHD